MTTYITLHRAIGNIPIEVPVEGLLVEEGPHGGAVLVRGPTWRIGVVETREEVRAMIDQATSTGTR